MTAQTEELVKVTGQRDAALRVTEEAMRLMTDDQLIELRHRIDELERGACP